MPPVPLSGPTEYNSSVAQPEVDDETLLREYRLRLASKYQSESEVERNALKASYEASLRSAGVPMPTPIVHAVEGFPNSGGVRMMPLAGAGAAAIGAGVNGGFGPKGKDHLVPLQEPSEFNSEASTPSCYQSMQGIPQQNGKGKQRQSIGGGMTPTSAGSQVRPTFVPELRQLKQTQQQQPQQSTHGHVPSPMPPPPNNSAQSSILRGGNTPANAASGGGARALHHHPHHQHSLSDLPRTMSAGAAPTGYGGAITPRARGQSLGPSSSSVAAMGGNRRMGGGYSTTAAMGPYASQSNPNITLNGPIGAPTKEDEYWFPNPQRVARKVAFSHVQKVQDSVKQVQYTTQFPAHIAGITLPGISPEGHSYMDYTYDEAELCEAKPPCMDRLMEFQGHHHVKFEWCGMCELAVNHRKGAWAILTALMRVFPDLDYMHSLPSELCTKHHSELLNPAPHRTSTADCKEMALVFCPRGGEPKRLQPVPDAAAAVQFIRDELEAMPPTNLAVTLLNARNLEPRKSLFGMMAAKNNPYVVFSLMGVETTERESQPVSNSVNPDYGPQLFTFRIVDPVTTKLRVDVYCHEKGKKREKQHRYGGAVVSLQNLKIGEANRLTVELGMRQEVSLVLMAEGSPFTPLVDENGNEVVTAITPTNLGTLNAINRRISYRVDRNGQQLASPRTDQNSITPRSWPSTARSNRSQTSGGTGGDLSARPGDLSARDPDANHNHQLVPPLPLSTTPVQAPAGHGLPTPPNMGMMLMKAPGPVLAPVIDLPPTQCVGVPVGEQF